jgi:hypothetical protein
MNRLSRVATLLTVALGVLIALAPAPARADSIGGVIVIPGSGNDLHAIRLRTSAGCPAQANAFYATMRGRGFPPGGQVVTTNTGAGLSHSFGFDVYFELVMRDFANDNHTTLGGRYDITVFCINRLTLRSYGEFTGSLEFTSPNSYEAIGAAKPIGEPPPPLEQAADGSALAESSLAGTPSETDPLSGAAHSPPGPTAQGSPRTGSQPSPVAGQLTSQRSSVTGSSIPWFVLVGAVLVTAVVTLVVVAVANRIRNRRSW